MPATCLVSAADYRRHWLTDQRPPDPAWDGTERRLATADRRAPTHERRWDASRGRRFQVGDRRQPQPQRRQPQAP
jgi:hypothetical protein